MRFVRSIVAIYHLSHSCLSLCHVRAHPSYPLAYGITGRRDKVIDLLLLEGWTFGLPRTAAGGVAASTNAGRFNLKVWQDCGGAIAVSVALFGPPA